MRIAFCNGTRIWSGVKTWMLAFGRQLQARGHTVHIYASDARFVEACAEAGLAAHAVRFGADYNPLTVAQFRRAFRAAGIQVVVCNIQKELRTAGIAARLLGIPVVQRVGLVGDLNRKWDQRLARRWLVDHLLVPSHWMRTELLRRFPELPADRLSAIHSGKPVTGRPREAPHVPLRLVITARLASGKGHADLLQALHALRTEGAPPLHLDVYGEGNQRAALEAQAAGLALGEVVAWHGFQQDVPAVLAGADAGVLASHNEGFPNTVLEYLAAGLPVVAADCGGVAEVVRPGHNGWLYPPGDVPALTAALRALLTLPPADYARLSAAAMATIQDEFDEATQAAALEALLSRVAGMRA